MIKQNKIKYLPWGTKVFISGTPVWLDSELVKDTIRKGQRKSDLQMYLDTHKQMQEGKLTYSNIEWTVVAIVKRNEKDYYILRNGFENVVITEVKDVYEKSKPYICPSNPAIGGVLKISDYLLNDCKVIWDLNNAFNTLSAIPSDTKLTICGPHTKLSKNKKTYSTTCLKGDTMDREKAVMLLLLQSMGVSYGKITRLIEDAKVYEWEDKTLRNKTVESAVFEGLKYPEGEIKIK